MRMLVVGAGATGGYFGGRLAAAGQDVTFLLRPGRAAAIRRDGLRLRSPHGDVDLQPQIVTADAIGGPYDVVLLTVKAFSLAAAMEDVAPAVEAGAMVMPVLNGMRHIEALQERFGAGAVIGGVCKVAATIAADGSIVQLNKMQELSYGELGGAASERTAALDAFMQKGGFAARLSGAIDQELWDKWVLLAAIGGITTLMGGAIGLVESVGGADFARRFLGECAAVATAAGRRPGEAFLATTETAVTAKGSPLNTSMYRDFEAGLTVEAAQILGDMVARGRDLGVSTPLLEAAWLHLAVYEKKLGGDL